ncbi:hypothetical protein TcCL_NonESM07296 [Trypanosoma cruzi]|nr:hypothetical protein TcCL_NonESM07296 [Trypanosoma cruzi]
MVVTVSPRMHALLHLPRAPPTTCRAGNSRGMGGSPGFLIHDAAKWVSRSQSGNCRLWSCCCAGARRLGIGIHTCSGGAREPHGMGRDGRWSWCAGVRWLRIDGIPSNGREPVLSRRLVVLAPRRFQNPLEKARLVWIFP